MFLQHWDLPDELDLAKPVVDRQALHATHFESTTQSVGNRCPLQPRLPEICVGHAVPARDAPRCRREQNCQAVCSISEHGDQRHGRQHNPHNPESGDHLHPTPSQTEMMVNGRQRKMRRPFRSRNDPT